jgi:hypothetical protein
VGGDHGAALTAARVAPPGRGLASGQTKSAKARNGKRNKLVHGVWLLLLGRSERRRPSS